MVESNQDRVFSLSKISLKDSSHMMMLLNEFNFVSSSSGYCFPPMVLLLQHFEVFLDSNEIQNVAILVSDYFKDQRCSVRRDFDSNFLALSTLHTQLQLICGKTFDSVCQTLRNGSMSMAMGLGPSFTVRSKGCSCGAARYLHLFCPQCGNFFNVKQELIDLHIVEDSMASKGYFDDKFDVDKRKKHAHKAVMEGK